MELYRHGDILLARVEEEVPVDAKKLRHLVLAEGELTGHAHRIAERDRAELFRFLDHRHQEVMYLKITAPEATLVHQEHGPITLRQGVYTFWRQREYSPRDIRYVRD